MSWMLRFWTIVFDCLKGGVLGIYFYMKIVISENQLSNFFVRRRINNLHNNVVEEYLWLDPKRYDNYDRYFGKVVVGAVTNFLFHELNSETVDDLVSIRDAALPIMKEFIAQNYGDEIRAHYDKVRMK